MLQAESMILFPLHVIGEDTRFSAIYADMQTPDGPGCGSTAAPAAGAGLASSSAASAAWDGPAGPKLT